MRVHELINETNADSNIFENKLAVYLRDTRSWFDKWMDQYVESGEIDREQLLTEVFSNDAIRKKLVSDFIILHKQNSLTPILNEIYAPTGFVLNGALKRLQILTSESEMMLVDIISPREYIFNCSEEIVVFPYEHYSNFSIGDTFFYQTIDEAHSIIPMIIMALQFPDWGVEQSIIQKNGERIIL